MIENKIILSKKSRSIIYNYRKILCHFNYVNDLKPRHKKLRPLNKLSISLTYLRTFKSIDGKIKIFI